MKKKRIKKFIIKYLDKWEKIQLRNFNASAIKTIKINMLKELHNPPHCSAHLYSLIAFANRRFKLGFTKDEFEIIIEKIKEVER